MFRSTYARLLRRVRMARLNLAVFFMPRLAGADGADEPPKEPATKAEPAAKTFTQEELDRIVQDRLARAKKDAPSDDEIESLRAAAAKLAEIEEASKSDLEKAAARAEKAEQDRDAAFAERDAANEALASVQRKSAIVTAAAEAGADPDTVYALLTVDGYKVAKGDENFEVTIGDGGQVTGAKEAVSALIELKNLAGNTTPPGPGDGGPRTPVPAQTLAEQIAAAEAAGDTDTAMSLKSQKLAGLVTGT